MNQPIDPKLRNPTETARLQSELRGLKRVIPEGAEGILMRLKEVHVGKTKQSTVGTETSPQFDQALNYVGSAQIGSEVARLAEAGSNNTEGLHRLPLLRGLVETEPESTTTSPEPTTTPIAEVDPNTYPQTSPHTTPTRPS